MFGSELDHSPSPLLLAWDVPLTSTLLCGQRGMGQPNRHHGFLVKFFSCNVFPECHVPV